MAWQIGNEGVVFCFVLGLQVISEQCEPAQFLNEDDFSLILLQLTNLADRPRRWKVKDVCMATVDWDL